MCCVMGYTGHDLSAAKFKEYLLRTVMRGPDDQRAPAFFQSLYFQQI